MSPDHWTLQPPALSIFSSKLKYDSNKVTITVNGNLGETRVLFRSNLVRTNRLNSI